MSEKEYTQRQTIGAEKSAAGEVDQAHAQTDPWISCGIGRSGRNGVQIPEAIAAKQGRFSALAKDIRANSKCGPKSECPCIYVGTPQRAGSVKKDNCAEVRLFAADLDSVCKSDDDVLQVLGFLESLGSAYIIHTTSSHNPAGGKWRIRIFLPFAQACSYEQYKLVGRRILVRIAGAMGHKVEGATSLEIDRGLARIGIDPASLRGMQPAYIPRWANEDIEAQAWFEHRDGPALEIAADLEEVRQAPAPPPRPRLHHVALGVVGDSRAATRYARYLEALGPAVEGSGGHQLTWSAVVAAVGFALPLEDAWSALEAWNRGCSPPWSTGALRTRLEGGYRDCDRSPGWLLEGCIQTSHRLDTPLLPDLDTPLVYTTTNQPTSGRGVSTSPVDSDDPTAARVNRRYLSPVGAADIARISARVWYRDSACDSGKNYSLRPLIAEYLEEGKFVLQITPTVAQAVSGARLFDLTLYKNVNGEITRSASVCLPSCSKVDLFPLFQLQADTGEYPIALTLLDECEETFSQFTASEIHGKDLASNYSHFSALLNLSAKIIAQGDGCLDTEIARNGLKRILKGEYSERTQVNTFRRPRRGLRYKAKNGLTQKLIDGVIAAVADPQAPRQAAFLSTKKQTKLQAKILSTVPGAAILAINADTVDTPEVQAFFADPNGEALKYHAVLYNQAMASNVSVDIGIWEVYGFGHGGWWTDCREQFQGLSRFRNALNDTWHIWYKGKGKQGSPDPETCYEILCEAAFAQESRLKAVTLWSPKYDPGTGKITYHPKDDEITRLFADVHAQRNQWSDLDKSLEYYFSTKGVTLEEGTYTALPATAELEKYIKTEIAAEEKQAVRAEIPRSKEEIKEIRAFAGTPENAVILKSHSIRERYGISDSEEIPADLYDRDQKSRYWQGVKQNAHSEALEEGEPQALLRLEAADFDVAGGSLAVQARQAYRKADLMRRVLKRFGITSARYHAENKTPLDVPSIVLTGAERAEIHELFGFVATNMTPIQIAAELLHRRGQKLKSKLGPRDSSQKRKRVWTLDLGVYEQTRKDGASYRKRLRDPTKTDAAPDLYAGMVDEASILEALAA